MPATEGFFSALLEFQAKQMALGEVKRRGHLKVSVSVTPRELEESSLSNSITCMRSR